MTREEVAKLLAMMTATWPNHPIPNPEAMTMAYWMGLDDVAADAVTEAFRRHMKDPNRGRFFPTVADLRGSLPTLSTAPMLPAGTETEGKPMMVYQVFDVDADDYLPLAVPVPLHSDEGQEFMRLSKTALIEAGRRDAAKTAEAA